MKLNDVKPKHICGVWCKDGLIVNLKDINHLDESTIKDLRLGLDGKFLNQSFREGVLTGVKLIGFDPYDTMNFEINSSENPPNGIKYICSIKFLQWDEITQDPDLTPVEKARMLLWISPVQLNCTDPSFLYYYQYILTQLDAAIYPEDRYPKRNNKNLHGTACKHLARILKVVNFYLGDMAREIKKQQGGSSSGIKELINNRLDLEKSSEE